MSIDPMENDFKWAEIFQTLADSNYDWVVEPGRKLVITPWIEMKKCKVELAPQGASFPSMASLSIRKLTSR